MLISHLKSRLPVNVQEGRVNFFTIMMIVVLVIAAAILIMVLSEVLKKEMITLTIQVKNDIGDPIPGAGISINDQHAAYVDSNGVYGFAYPTTDQNQRRHIKAEMVDFQPAETTLYLGAKPAAITLILLKPFATLNVMTLDSITSAPISGVAVYIGNDLIDTTGDNGKLTLPSGRIRLHDNPILKLEKKKYQSRLEYLYVASTEQTQTIMMAPSQGGMPGPPPRKITSPVAFNFFKEKARIVETAKWPEGELQPHGQLTQPQIQENVPGSSTAPLVIDTTMPPETAAKEDSALIYMMNGDYRSALDLYTALTSQKQWQARADFWLYGADCALHMANDAAGQYNAAIIDTALKFLDEAERYQNRIQEDIFPAIVQTKKGEAWAYMCELPSARNPARLQEYRQKARYFLRSAIAQFSNRNLIDNDFYRFAVKTRDDVENK
jgi:hypothetical protein